jgi:hypothetical protein
MYPQRSAISICRLVAVLLCTAACAGQEFYKSLDHPDAIDPQLAITGSSRVCVGTQLDLQFVALGHDGEPTSMPNLPALTCHGPCRPNECDDAGAREIPIRCVQTGIYRPAARFTLDEPGYFLFTVRDPAGQFLPCGLPVRASEKEPALQLYWADLHGHSTLSDGARAPEEFYRWARDVARLDAVALTDHNWALDDQKIARLRELAQAWYEPGRFVPFFAFEWAPGSARSAPARGRPDHKNLIFRHADESLTPWAPAWSDTASVSELWRMLDGREVLAIPHHTGLPHATFYGTDWSLHDERFERVAEVFSDWGSSETPDDRYPLPEKEPGNFVRDALALGQHLGLVGGSDTHGSRPGLNALPHAGHPYPLMALTAIEAPAHTRDDLWLAIYNRRCYAASTGRRPLLAFTVNGQPMGARLAEPFRRAPRRIEVTITGSSPIEEILIVKNSAPAARFPGDGWCQTIEWVDQSPSPNREDCYYVRAEMEDTSMVWSSPIWVEGPANPDLSAEARLWRLDGDVLGRRLHTVRAEGADISGGQPLVLCNVDGPGAIDRFVVEVQLGEDESAARAATLSIWTDGRSELDVTACLDQLCFVAMGGKPFATDGVAFADVQRSDGRWLVFTRDLRVPFARSCRVELTPPPDRTLPRVRSNVIYGPWQDGHLPQLGRMGQCITRSLRDCAVTGTGTSLELLNVTGRGLLHSLQLAMRNGQTDGQYMEGNIEIYVDGESRPAYASSGTEEFFYGGIYFINPFWTPMGGCTLSIHEPGNVERRTSAYRVFAKDPIPFDESLRIVWHNGQGGQGEVPGTTVVDAQSVLYLRRETEPKKNGEPALVDGFAQRLNLLDGAPELGPMVTQTGHFEGLTPGQSATLCNVEGAGNLHRLQLLLKGDAPRCTRAHLIIESDGHTVCDEPLAALFGAGATGLDFTAGFVGQTASVDGQVRLQRALRVPHREALTIRIVANEDSGVLDGGAVIERRVAHGGLPADFGPAQRLTSAYGSWQIHDRPRTLRLSVPTQDHAGWIQELGLTISGLPNNRAPVPAAVALACDGQPIAHWTAEQFAPGLEPRGNGARSTSSAVCLREDGIWQTLVSFREMPFAFQRTAHLEIDAASLPDGATVAAHLLVSCTEPGPVREDPLPELTQRLNALDGGVLAGKAICRTVLEDGDIAPGASAVLMDLAGNGTVRCLRIGTPSSGEPLGRSLVEIDAGRSTAVPTVAASVDNLFATWFDPFPFWQGAGDVVRPSQLHRQTGGHHTSSYCLLNLPFIDRCRVSLSAPADDDGALRWLQLNLPATSPRTALRAIADLPDDVRNGLERCADISLFIQVYANRVDGVLDWGRWGRSRFVSVDGQEVAPGQTLCLARISGRGALHGLQLALETSEPNALENGALEIFVDGEPSPSWVSPSLNDLFLGTPVPGSGQGKQIWEAADSRGREPVGAGARLMSADAGTTICTSTPPYRFGGLRRFHRGVIPFDESIRVMLRLFPDASAPTRLWALTLLTTENDPSTHRVRGDQRGKSKIVTNER